MLSISAPGDIAFAPSYWISGVQSITYRTGPRPRHGVNWDDGVKILERGPSDRRSHEQRMIPWLSWSAKRGIIALDFHHFGHPAQDHYGSAESRQAYSFSKVGCDEQRFIGVLRTVVRY